VFDEIFESHPDLNVAEIEFLARFVGCSDAVVRRWCRSLKLKFVGENV
jgi:hypothetical protein